MTRERHEARLRELRRRWQWVQRDVRDELLHNLRYIDGPPSVREMTAAEKARASAAIAAADLLGALGEVGE